MLPQKRLSASDVCVLEHDPSQTHQTKRIKIQRVSQLECLLSLEQLTLVHFAEYLSASSMFALRQACTIGYKTSNYWKTHRVLLKRVKAKFEQLGLHALFQSGAVISGSWLLQCLNNDLEANDIDIFQPVNFYGPVSVLERTFLEQKFPMKTLFSQSCYGDVQDVSAIRNWDVPKKNSYHRSKCETNKIQCISVYTQSIQKWILEGFDIDFLTSTFDGNNLYIHAVSSLANRSGEIRSRNIKIISNTTNESGASEDFNQKCKFFLGRHFSRMFKYWNRNYAFDNVTLDNCTIGNRQLLKLTWTFAQIPTWILQVTNCSLLSNSNGLDTQFMEFYFIKITDLQLSVHNRKFSKFKSEIVQSNDVQDITTFDHCGTDYILLTCRVVPKQQDGWFSNDNDNGDFQLQRLVNAKFL